MPVSPDPQPSTKRRFRNSHLRWFLVVGATLTFAASVPALGSGLPERVVVVPRVTVSADNPSGDVGPSSEAASPELGPSPTIAHQSTGSHEPIGEPGTVGVSHMVGEPDVPPSSWEPAESRPTLGVPHEVGQADVDVALTSSPSVESRSPDVDSARREYEALRSPAMEPGSNVPEELISTVVNIFPSAEWGRALAVSWCESRWGADKLAFDQGHPDAGWFQINRHWHEQRAAQLGWSWDQVRLDLAVNVTLAVHIWQESGWGAWSCSSVLT
jgi:hypothetical protein